MEFSFTATTSVSSERVWEQYSVLENWYTWEEDLKNISLEGAFMTGSRGIMELEGMPPMAYVLSLVEEGSAFWDETETPFGVIRFGHELVSSGDGTLIRHVVQLDGAEERPEAAAFLKQVFADVPDSVLMLKKAVESKD